VIAAVLDVNVLASGSIAIDSSRSAAGELFRRWEQDEFELVTSQHIIDGLRRTLARPYFAARVKPDQSLRTIGLLLRRARIVSVVARVSGVAPDDEDDQVLAAAVSAGARFLVTGDRAFLRVGAYHGVELLSPRAFLDLLIADLDETLLNDG
jgi:putative PIN family toxin of toxin-antitoxin system